MAVRWTWARICKPLRDPRNHFPAWKNRFLGISSWAPWTFTNTGSVPKFINVEGARESIPRNQFRYVKESYRTGSPGYIGWKNRFLGSLNVYKFGLWYESREDRLHYSPRSCIHIHERYKLDRRYSYFSYESRADISNRTYGGLEMLVYTACSCM